MAYKHRISYCNISYIDLCAKFRLQPLSLRRKQLDIRNFHKIINGHVNCPDLLQEVKLAVPTRSLRNNRLFLSTGRLQLRLNSFLPRVHKLAEKFKHTLDLFDSSIVYVKRAVSTLDLS
jgi:hypothetical protein